MSILAKNTGSYSYSPEKVLIVKKYLDDNFSHDPDDFKETMGPDGYIKRIPITFMKSPVSGKKLHAMFDEDLLELLCSKFSSMFTAEDEKTKFLGQVMRDWYEDKIGLYGSLSVNHL
jgi:hypothetical protein